MQVIACTKTVYVEDLTYRLEPVRLTEWYGGTPTYIYKNNYVYEPGYYVYYNKARVTWYTNRKKEESISMPTNEVFKIRYRSRVLGTVAGFAGGYAVGFVLYNLGILGKSKRPFLSETNHMVNLTTAGMFAVAGFSVGIPVTYIFKIRGNQTPPVKEWNYKKSETRF